MKRAASAPCASDGEQRRRCKGMKRILPMMGGFGLTAIEKCGKTQLIRVSDEPEA